MGSTIAALVSVSRGQVHRADVPIRIAVNALDIPGEHECGLLSSPRTKDPTFAGLHAAAELEWASLEFANYLQSWWYARFYHLFDSLIFEGCACGS